MARTTSTRSALAGLLDPPKCTLQGGYTPVGPPNLLIDTVENQSEVQIRIDKDSASCVLPEARGLAYDLRRYPV